MGGNRTLGKTKHMDGSRHTGRSLWMSGNYVVGDLHALRN